MNDVPGGPGPRDEGPPGTAASLGLVRGRELTVALLRPIGAAVVLLAGYFLLPIDKESDLNYLGLVVGAALLLAFGSAFAFGGYFVYKGAWRRFLGDLRKPAGPLVTVLIVAGAGAVYSTLDDLLAWQRALHRGEVLTPFSYQQMLTDHSPEDTPKERGRPHRAWGYGIFSNRLGEQVTPSFEDRQIYHTGSWGGFRNLMLYQPEADISVIVLSNNYHLRDQVFLIAEQAMAEALGREFPTGLDR